MKVCASHVALPNEYCVYAPVVKFSRIVGAASAIGGAVASAIMRMMNREDRRLLIIFLGTA